MLVEFHVLKNFPATNLNRDEQGAPKTCFFGGVLRSRISSQCLKRSWRRSPLFVSELGRDKLGIRTRLLPKLVGDELLGKGVSEDFVNAVKDILAFAGKKKRDDKKKKKIDKVEEQEGNETNTEVVAMPVNNDITKQIVIYSHNDIDNIVSVCLRAIEEMGSVSAFRKKYDTFESLMKGVSFESASIDVALFGRMVTSAVFPDVDATMQVAHAFSVNKLRQESDFFTAMDDMLEGVEDNGSAMMGDVDYNSSCYYMYSSWDVDAFRKKMGVLGSDPDNIVCSVAKALARVIAFTNPSGKQNTFAGHSLPSVILVECKDYPVPVSYANAFVSPIVPGNGSGLVQNAVDRLFKFVDETDNKFCLPVKKRFWFCAGMEHEMKAPGSGNIDVVECGNFNELVDGLCAVFTQGN